MLPIWNNWIWVCKLDLSRPDGCQFGFGGGSRPLVFFRRCPGWMLPISNNWIWVCKLDLSRPDGCQFGFGGGSRPLVFFRRCLTGCFQSRTLDLRLQAGPVQSRRVPVWVWDGSRPLLFFRRCLDWLLPILNNWIWSASWTCPDQTGASLGLGVARGLWFSSDGALTGCFWGPKWSNFARLSAIVL